MVYSCTRLCIIILQGHTNNQAKQPHKAVTQYENEKIHGIS